MELLQAWGLWCTPAHPHPNSRLTLLGWRQGRSLCCPLSPAGLHFIVRAQCGQMHWKGRVFGGGRGWKSHDASMLSASRAACISLIQVHSDQSCPFCLPNVSCSPTGSTSRDCGLILIPSPVPSTSSCRPNWMATSPPGPSSDGHGHCSSDKQQLTCCHAPCRPWSWESWPIRLCSSHITRSWPLGNLPKTSASFVDVQPRD